MPIRPYILAETNWNEVKETEYDVAILPWGATEAHNYHLPYATDNYQCDAVAAESARKAWEAGARPIVLPTVPFGVNTGQLDIKLDINMNPSTQQAIIADVADVLERHDVPRLLVLNGHGGNGFNQILRELQPQFPDVFLCTASWFRVGDQTEFFDEPGDHAGEMETSVMMHIAGDLVRPLEEAGDGAARTFIPDALNADWAWAQREWSQVTEDTGVGDPKASSAEKGEAYLNFVSDEIAQFLIDLSNTDPKAMYR